jgi:hypothetical protein
VTAATRAAQRDLDRAAGRYDPASHGYDLAKDPRCLFGWGPPDCPCMFGHACFRALGHPGLCGDPDEPHRRRRPKDWDTVGRAEANR